jgi:hypothetical protein
MRRADRIADHLVHRFGEAIELADIEVDPATAVALRLARDEHNLGLNDPRVADHAAPWLDDRLGDAVAKMAPKRAKDGLPISFDRWHVLEIARREAAAEIDHRKLDAALGEIAEDRRRGLQRAVPDARIALLRADMEGETMGHEPQLMGALEHARRHLRRAAELARERPLRAGPVAENPAENLRSGRGACDLFNLRLAVDRVEPDA